MFEIKSINKSGSTIKIDLVEQDATPNEKHLEILLDRWAIEILQEYLDALKNGYGEDGSDFIDDFGLGHA